MEGLCYVNQYVYNRGSCKYEEISGLWLLGAVGGILNVVLTVSSLVVTLCTTRFNIQQFCIVFTLRLCVVCGPQNKHLPYMTLTM